MKDDKREYTDKEILTDRGPDECGVAKTASQDDVYSDGSECVETNAGTEKNAASEMNAGTGNDTLTETDTGIAKKHISGRGGYSVSARARYWIRLGLYFAAVGAGALIIWLAHIVFRVIG
ncbi:MAG: hypothetical protein LBC13_02760 [Clostridiales bacterium]|jgi:hypothetical protein|nr:hypothetical protein [Clostridiales bacterium]